MTVKLFDALDDPSISDQIDCVKREIYFRKKLYPKWVQTGKMTQDKSDWEIECMEAVLKTLLGVTE